VGRDQTDAAETTADAADTGELRQLHRVGLAEDHVLDTAASIDEEAELTPELMGEFEEIAGERR